MFNLKNIKAQVTNTEKYLRDESVGPQADDDQPITEKALEDRDTDLYYTTEYQLDQDRDKTKEAQVIEKVLNSTKGDFIKHRSAEDGLTVPPINTIVAKMEKERLESYKTEKKENWTTSTDDKNQNGSLPKWPKTAPQRDKNKELTGGLTVADVTQMVINMKNGAAVEYDAAILAILKEADTERRELTQVERKAVSDLKIARTRALLKK